MSTVDCVERDLSEFVIFAAWRLCENLPGSDDITNLAKNRKSASQLQRNINQLFKHSPGELCHLGPANTASLPAGPAREQCRAT